MPGAPAVGLPSCTTPGAMDWGALSFLAEPWFVIPWYVIGVAGAVWVVLDARRDPHRVERPYPRPLQGAWPVVVVFFSVIGLLLYVVTARPRGAGFHTRPPSTFRAVTDSVVHSVGGDGLGIITAMLVARALDFTFWPEFWLEYAVGFAVGCLAFQYATMRTVAAPTKALWMAARAEWFSMMTVMAGMGLVIGVVMPLVVGEQPRPDTWAFWGFTALGLLVASVVTYPMNWALVRIHYKRGWAAGRRERESQ